MIQLAQLAFIALLFQATNPAIPRLNGNDMKHQIVKSIQPTWPSQVKKAQRVPTTVIMVATISESGKVVSARYQQGSKFLVQSATDCLMKWKFVATGKKYMGPVSVAFKP